MPPLPPANLTPKERAARKAALTRSIKIRTAELARLRLYVRDLVLEARIRQLQDQVQELNAERTELDKLDPLGTQDRARRMLGYQRYE